MGGKPVFAQIVPQVPCHLKLVGQFHNAYAITVMEGLDHNKDVQCELGNYADFQSQLCFLCPAGKYSSSRGMYFCDICEAGKFLDILVQLVRVRSAKLENTVLIEVRVVVLVVCPENSQANLVQAMEDTRLIWCLSHPSGGAPLIPGRYVSW